MTIQAAVSEEGKCCKRCIQNDEDRERRMENGEVVGRRQVAHCHCSFLEPDPEVISDMRTGGPAQRWLQKRKDSNNNKNGNELEERKKADTDAEKLALSKEVAKLKKKSMEEAVNDAKEKLAAKPIQQKSKLKRPAKLVKVDIVAKRKKLGFVDAEEDD